MWSAELEGQVREAQIRGNKKVKAEGEEIRGRGQGGWRPGLPGAVARLCAYVPVPFLSSQL